MLGPMTSIPWQLMGSQKLGLTYRGQVASNLGPMERAHLQVQVCDHSHQGGLAFPAKFYGALCWLQLPNEMPQV